MLEMHQVVRVIKDAPGQGVREGMVGAVIAVFDSPARAYEVEFVNSEGRTALQATLAEDELEAVATRGPGSAQGDSQRS